MVPNMIVASLIIRNIPASLDNNIVSCTAELNNMVMASCTPQILQVQGNCPTVCWYVYKIRETFLNEKQHYWRASEASETLLVVVQ